MAYGYRPRRSAFPKRKTYPKKKMATKAKVARKVSTTNFNKKVMAVLHRTRETKMKSVNLANEHFIIGQGLNATTQNVGTPSRGYIVPNILDNINLLQGTDQETRIGNSIENAKLVLSGVIRSLPYHALDPNNPTGTYNGHVTPFEVHMVIYKKKNDILGEPLHLKHESATNTTGICDGTLSNTLYPYNKDSYIIHKVRVFKLRGHREQETYQNQPYIDLTGAQDQSLPIVHRFKQSIPISKKLMYRDQAWVPTNSWASVAFYVVDLTGAVINTLEHRAVLYLDATLTFEDA